MFDTFICATSRANLIIGRTVAWLCVVMILLTVGIVMARSLFNVNSQAVQESVTYLHASLFLLCLATGVVNNGHVRVDVFYRRLSATRQHWIDAFGALLFLLPFSLFLLYASWNFAGNAWRILETSSDPGGLPFIYLLKTLVPFTAILLIFQAIAECIRHIGAIYHVEPQNKGDDRHA